MNPRYRDGVQRPLLGISLVVAGFQFLPLMDAVAKYLAADYPVAQVVWARFAFHSAFVLPFVLWRYGPRALWPVDVRLHLARACCQLAGTVFFFGALVFISIVDALAMAFVAPFVVTVLSPWLLGEQVGARRYAAVAVGLVGVLLVVRPGSGVFHWGSLLALATGVALAFFLLLTRMVSGRSPASVTLVFTGLVGALAMSLAMPFVWRAPDPAAWGWMAMLGLLAAAGHLLLIRAYEYAAASLLAPYGYSEMFTAGLVSYYVFGQIPDALGWLGVSIVVASGVYIALRERKLHQP